MGLSFFQKLQKRDRSFSVEIDGLNIPVSVVENNRAKRLVLRLSPSGRSLRVTTPGHVGDSEIEAFVHRNRDWAAACFSRMPDTVVPAWGVPIPFRGLDHEIRPTGNLRGLVRAEQDNGSRILLVPGEENAVGRKLLGFFKSEARRELDLAVARHTAELGVRAKRLRITDTTSRWGSCSSTRTLSFSWRIILAPPEVLDYLAAHEVAHLVEMNHSRNFWNLTRKLCPQMDRHKAWLRANGSRLHAISL